MLDGITATDTWRLELLLVEATTWQQHNAIFLRVDCDADALISWPYYSNRDSGTAASCSAGVY
jgi:hypothetical protein